MKIALILLLLLAGCAGTVDRVADAWLAVPPSTQATTQEAREAEAIGLGVVVAKTAVRGLPSGQLIELGISMLFLLLAGKKKKP